MYCSDTEELQFPKALVSQTFWWFKPKLTSFPQENTVIWYIPRSNLTPISFYLILLRSWDFCHLHRQIGWFSLWAIGTQNSGPVNFIPEPDLPFAQISSTYLKTATKPATGVRGLRTNKTKILIGAILTGKTGIPFQEFCFSQENFPLEWLQRAVLLFQLDLSEILGKGKQPRIPQSSLEASATSQTCHSPEFCPCCNRICFSEFCSIKIKQMRVNRGVIPLAKIPPHSCSKRTEMHFQLFYVKMCVYSRQDTDVLNLSPLSQISLPWIIPCSWQNVSAFYTLP